MSTPLPTQPHATRYKRLIQFLWASFGLFIAGLVLYVLAVSINFLYLFGPLPDLRTLENPKSELASEVYSADNVELGKYFRENRTPVEYTDLPQNLIDALMATEDIRFEEHSGIDFKGTFAILAYQLKRSNRGSSTITQQLAKNLFRTRSDLNDGLLSHVPGLNKLIVKTKEWIMAVKLERNYSKKEIITMYLNTVDFGSNAFGIKVAAKTFFNKQPAQLKPQESAVLVGLLKAPTYYSPVQNPKSALIRRNTVLAQMEKYDFITEEQYEQLAAQPIRLNYNVENQNKGIAPYFRAEASKFLLKWCKDNGHDLYSDGLKIYTTLDSRLQQYAEEAVEKHMRYQQRMFWKHWNINSDLLLKELARGNPNPWKKAGGLEPWTNEDGEPLKNFIKQQMKRTLHYKRLKEKFNGDTLKIDQVLNTRVPMAVFCYECPGNEIRVNISPYDSLRYYKHFLHTGLMSIEPATGHIKAWVGGTNYKYFKYDHVKQGARQPGSTFKPFVYVAAIDRGYSPCYEVIDAPVTFQTQDAAGSWTPKNVDGSFSGNTYTLRKALALSINSITAFLMKKLTPQVVVEYAQKLGITTPLDPVPPLALGSSDVTIYDMVGAYSTFFNKGVWTEPFYITRIEDKNGNLLQEFVPKTREVLTEETAYIMTYMLQASTERGGTAVGLRGRYGISGDVAAKTGTTSNYSDGWFMGAVPGLLTGVWVGGEDRSIHFKTMDLGQGGRMAMPIWGYFMQKTYTDKSLGIGPKAFPKPASHLTVEINCERYKSGLPDSIKAEEVLKLPGKAKEDVW